MSDNLNISPDMIENLVNMLKKNMSQTQSEAESTTSSAESTTSKPNNSNLDLETIMKMKSIISALGSVDDSDSKLLYSLKPYLRKSKQDKLDQLINILKISKVTKKMNIT